MPLVNTKNQLLQQVAQALRGSYTRRRGRQTEQTCHVCDNAHREGESHLGVARPSCETARELAALVERLQTQDGNVPWNAEPAPPPVRLVGQCPHCGVQMSDEHVCDSELLEKYAVMEQELTRLKTAGFSAALRPQTPLDQAARERRFQQEIEAARATARETTRQLEELRAARDEFRNDSAAQLSGLISRLAMPNEDALPERTRLELGALRTLYRRSRGHICPVQRACRLCEGIVEYERLATETHGRAAQVMIDEAQASNASPVATRQIAELRESLARSEALRVQAERNMQQAQNERNSMQAQLGARGVSPGSAHTPQRDGFRWAFLREISERVGTYGGEVVAYNHEVEATEPRGGNPPVAMNYVTVRIRFAREQL